MSYRILRSKPDKHTDSTTQALNRTGFQSWLAPFGVINTWRFQSAALGASRGFPGAFQLAPPTTLARWSLLISPSGTGLLGCVSRVHQADMSRYPQDNDASVLYHAKEW